MTCRMKVAYCSWITGMEAHRIKPRHSRDVKASEGTVEQRAAAEGEEPGSEGKGGCEQEKNQNCPNRTRSHLNTSSSVLLTLRLYVNQMCRLLPVSWGSLTHSQKPWPLNRLQTTLAPCNPESETMMMAIIVIIVIYSTTGDPVIAKDRKQSDLSPMEGMVPSPSQPYNGELGGSYRARRVSEQRGIEKTAAQLCEWRSVFYPRKEAYRNMST